MLALIPPAARLRDAWLDAHAEWGEGRHEDGFGLTGAEELSSPAGFAAWVAHCEQDPGLLRRWIIDADSSEDRVLGGIALRRPGHDHARVAGHIGYGVRPSARGRGIASWALARMLGEARAIGLHRVLLVCEAGNAASARVIERCGGVLEDAPPGRRAPVRRYWITLAEPASESAEHRPGGPG